MEQKVFHFRQLLMDVCYKNQSGHPSSALSCIELMTALYYGDILRYDLDNLERPDRDRFILSKGHACIGLYVILEDLGILDRDELYRYCKRGGILGGHINRLLVPGTEFSAGSLGHGLSYSVGQAMNLKFMSMDAHVYTLLGDGECEEGSVWEAAMTASHHRLDNLTVIIDNNKLQASDYTANITAIHPLKEKWRSFGFDVDEIDGHNLEEILNVLGIQNRINRPRAIIANTQKGKGVSLMEGKNHWHSRRPNKDEWKEVSDELRLGGVI